MNSATGNWMVVFGKFQPQGSDLAENYLSRENLEPADVVSLDPESGRVKLSKQANERLVLGVVSSAPAVLLNGNRLVPPPGSGEAGRRTEVVNESTMDYGQELL